jgi:hypothetical protein
MLSQEVIGVETEFAYTAMNDAVVVAPRYETEATQGVGDRDGLGHSLRHIVIGAPV